MNRKTFRKAYGVVRLAMHTPQQMTPAEAELNRLAEEGYLSSLLKVWTNRIQRVSFGECYAVDTPRDGFTRQDSIQQCLKSARYRRDSRRRGLPTGNYDRSPIPA